GAADAPLGSTVTIKLTDNRAVPAMELPLAAIYDNGKGPGVWVVQGERSKVAWRPVKLTGLGDETATVTGGIRAGEQFVALGAHLLHQGQLVRISADQGAGK
ncbi:MAG: efflux RND transporter periplasmic adaptor subunit, partial [Caulobacterales bacterium]